MPNLSYERARQLVLHALYTIKPIFQYGTICEAVCEAGVRQGDLSGETEINVSSSHGRSGLDDSDRDLVREVIWDLIIERVLTIGANESNPNWPFLSTTAYGRRVVTSPDPIPNDAHGYMTRLEKDGGELAPIVKSYVVEALATFRVGCYLASSVMLGAASEMALLNLVEAFSESISDDGKRMRFIASTQGKFIKQQFDELMKRLPKLTPTLGREMSEDQETMLGGIFSLIRRCRNDAGHPTGREIPRDLAFSNLQLFAHYHARVVKLTAHLTASKRQIDF